MIAIGTGGYILLAKGNIALPTNSSNYSNSQNLVGGKDGEAVDKLLTDKKLTTFAIFGVDRDGYRTDVTMLAFFNHHDASFDIVSVPRDTQVKIPDDIYADIKSRRSSVPQIIKVNEVPAYVNENANETSVAVIEASLGVDIDYYVNIDLSAFRFIVDQVGDVTVDIPMDMYYQDPEQGLNINLKKGIQTLNGAQAEQLIRFRSGYGTGDIGRIGMQHEFMKAFMEQLLTTKNRLNMVNIISAIMLKVDTDFVTALDYLVFLDKVSADKITMHMLPGEVKNSGRSYFIYDYDESKVLFNDIINKPYIDAQLATGEAGNTQAQAVVDVIPEEIVDVKSMKISVQNGTITSGLAGKYQGIIGKEGYQVVEAINYPTKPVERTILIVPHQVAFNELKVFFDDPILQLDTAMKDADIQVVVVLGKDAVE